jgi:GTPase SAR1 family protein
MNEAASSSKKTGGNSSKNKFKVVVLGDVMVGKTSFISRFLYGSFNSSYQVTIIAFFAFSLKEFF